MPVSWFTAPSPASTTAFLFASPERRVPAPETTNPRTSALSSAARLRHTRPVNSVSPITNNFASPPNTSSVQLLPQPPSISSRRTEKMDATLFEYFDLCGMGLWQASTTGTSTTSSSTNGVVVTKFSGVLDAVSTRLKGWLPRRLHEPTGPWGLMLDMLLSLFVGQGACRSVIDALPLEVVGEGDVCVSGDLESFGVSMPVREGDKCAICLGPYEEGDAVRHLGCNHAFHAECVDVWLERKSLCPICKTDTC